MISLSGWSREAQPPGFRPGGWFALTIIVSSMLSACTLVTEPLPHEREPLKVAVAANFKPVLERLINDSGMAIELSSGSTGALYAQIKYGAPYDIFFAADNTRPEKLESSNLTRIRKTYAYGRLVLWIPASAREESTPGESARGESTPGESALAEFSGTIAIANPMHAPYGRAAKELLSHFETNNTKPVFGLSVAQAFTFVRTGNAPAGLVGLSQVIASSISEDRYWLVPELYHEPIQQQLVVMKTAPGSAEVFLDFLYQETSQAVIAEAGYRLPEDDH